MEKSQSFQNGRMKAEQEIKNKYSIFKNALSGNARKFADACFDSSVSELQTALRGSVDQQECKQWGISANEWKEAIKTALEEKTK